MGHDKPTSGYGKCGGEEHVLDVALFRRSGSVEEIVSAWASAVG